MLMRVFTVGLILWGTLAKADGPSGGLIDRIVLPVEATDFEQVAPGEQALIAEIVKATGSQMAKRYQGNRKVLRNQHAKSHGCVAAKFTVRGKIDGPPKHGLFKRPKSYEAIVRFSNADSRIQDDSPEVGGSRIHGSRGMAIKVLGVSGESALPVHGALTQDFMMINSPVFVFANVEDYALVSNLIAKHGDVAGPGEFFKARLTGGTPEQKQRAGESRKIAGRIRSIGANPPPFQTPPTNPVENSYYGAAPFLYGSGHAMRYRVVPVSETPSGTPPVGDANYLRDGLGKRLQQCEPVRFVFEAQVRSKEQITDKATQIENASLDWDESEYPWIAMADLEITSTKALDEAKCESLVFTPWHCLKAHQPIGSINRLRKAVYLASAMIRSTPKEPETLGGKP